jgi:amidase/aspartyl-tRNA(Asn)/glutamyl-tRNA(Gln) amidotransferase subunit A
MKSAGTAPGPQSIPEWQDFTAHDALQAAQVLHSRVDALPGTQQRAVFAHLVGEAELARALQESLNCGGALSGTPYALKDLFDLKGVFTRAGSSFLQEQRPAAAHNSVIVDLLSARGAVCAAKTQLHEFAYGLTGENPFFGNVDNPAAPGCTTGGSSSGSAAAVAAGIVPFSIGTDTGGSVRVPAAFCGLFGFRMTPSHKWIADAFPLAPSCDTAGWFTANSADMQLLLRTLVSPMRMPAGRTPQGLYLPWGPLDPEVAELCLRHASGFARLADNNSAGQLHNAFAPGAQAYSILTSIEAAQVHREWLDTLSGRYSPAVLSRIRRGRNWSETAIIRAASDRQFLRSTLSSYFLSHDFLVLPASCCRPLRHEDCAAFDRERLLSLTAPASLAGYPVLTLPLKDERGNPVSGLQVILPRTDSPVSEWLLSQPACWAKRA